MRRTAFIALALFLIAALAVPAQAYKTYSSSHRYFQQQAAGFGGASVLFNVNYAKRSPHGKSTPRKVFVQVKAPVSCQVVGSTSAAGASGAFKLRGQRVEFSGSFSSKPPPTSNPNPGSSGAYYVTGRLIKKENKKKWRMDGTVTVLTYSSPPDFTNCSSAEIPYSANRCSWFPPATGTPPLCAIPYSARG
jgi:hypothetical protein